MAGPPPPLWANVGNNPNISRERPPPPIQPGEIPPPEVGIPVNNPPPSQPAPVGVIVNGPAPGPLPPIQLVNGAVAGPPPPPPPPFASMPPMPPFGFGGGMMMGCGPFGAGGMWGNGMTPPGIPPPPPPNSGVSPMPGWGVGGFAGAGAPPPFAPGGMPWAAGAGFGAGFGAWGLGGMHRPPPPFLEGAIPPPPRPQEDPTVKPGGDLPGHTVVEPAETTSLLRIVTNAYPWEQAGANLTIEPMQFDSGWTLNRVIAALRKPNKECQGWGVTECIEIGGGRWARGMTFVHGSHQASEQTLSMVGWGPNRGRDPNGNDRLYVYCHRI